MRTIDKGIPHAMQLMFPVFQTIGANSYIGAYTCDFIARTTAGSDIETFIFFLDTVLYWFYMFDRSDSRSRFYQSLQEFLLLNAGRLQHDKNSVIAIIHVSTQTHLSSQAVYTRAESYALHKTSDMYVILIHLQKFFQISF